MTITAVDVRSWALPGALCAALYFAMSYPLARLAARLEARLEAASGEPVVAQAHDPPRPRAAEVVRARPVLRGIDAEIAGRNHRACRPSGGERHLPPLPQRLEPFRRGSVEIDGLSLGPRTRRDAAGLRPLRARVGLVFQGFHLFRTSPLYRT